MTFTDRGTRVVMKIFTARVRSTRAVKIHYNPSAEVSKSHDMPDSEAGKAELFKCLGYRARDVDSSRGEGKKIKKNNK